MYLRAKPCLCDAALEFERGHCARCGRWMAHEILRPYDFEDVTPFEHLELGVAKWQIKIRQEFGMPLDLAKATDEQRAAYEKHLETELQILEYETREVVAV